MEGRGSKVSQYRVVIVVVCDDGRLLVMSGVHHSGREGMCSNLDEGCTNLDEAPSQP